MYVFSFATHTLFLEVFVHTYNNYVQNMALQSMKLKMYTVVQKLKKKIYFNDIDDRYKI